MKRQTRYYIFSIIVIAYLAGKCVYSFLSEKSKDIPTKPIERVAYESVQVKDELKDAMDTISNEVRKAFIDKLMEYRKSEVECWYFLFDITRNNTPEIWILTGSFEAEKELHVFTYSNQGTLAKIIDAPGDHSGFYLGGDYILQWKTHMGYEAWIKYYYRRNQIYSDVIYENQDTIDYTSPSEPYIELIPWEDEG